MTKVATFYHVASMLHSLINTHIVINDKEIGGAQCEAAVAYSLLAIVAMAGR
jgi:hypothetical protein